MVAISKSPCVIDRYIGFLIYLTYVYEFEIYQALQTFYYVLFYNLQTPKVTTFGVKLDNFCNIAIY